MSRARAGLADAERRCFWWEDPGRPDPADRLTGSVRADLAVVGGGYSGLWTALIAKQRDPSREVVLLEGRRIGWAASGRNGGFCAASLTHGTANGMARFPGEMPTLERLGRANLAGIVTAIEEFGIDCSLERTGELDVAVAPYQVEELSAAYEEARALGEHVIYLDTDAVRAEVNSPTYLAGVWQQDSVVMVNPARLAWGLADACRSLGVRIYEHSHVTSLDGGGDVIHLATPHGEVRADAVALGTNIFRPLLRRVRPYLVPVYDYALMTEPLSEAQLASIGWVNRQGVGDTGNQFHYYRLTDDNRILWGGYDAIYRFPGRVEERLTQRDATFELLADHFYETFPQLEDVRFSHRWGGIIDTCSRFFPFFGTAHGGRVAYAAGFTGLGVGATRFGADVMLDLLSGGRTELTELAMVRRKPIPFPPEPIRGLGVALTRASLARADEREGRRNLWLRALDAVGMGFDS